MKISAITFIQDYTAISSQWKETRKKNQMFKDWQGRNKTLVCRWYVCLFMNKAGETHWLFNKLI